MRVKSKVSVYAIRFFAGVLLATGFSTFVSVANAATTTTSTMSPDTPTGRHPGPQEIVFGTYIENIQGLDLGTNSFQADLYVWMRWMDPKLKPYESIEVMNPFETWAMSAVPVSETPIKQPDGSLYYSIRYQGGFNSNFNLAKFPFGEQQLHIQFEDKIFESSHLTYVLDTKPVTLDPEITIPGYDIGQPQINVREIEYTTSFGEYTDTTSNIYSRVTITIPVTHPFLSTSIKVLLPIVLIVATASLIFHIPPNLIEARIGLGITALLTLVAMQWSAMSSLPDGGYLVMLDVIYIISYAFVLITLVQTLTTSWKAKSGEERLAIRRDKQMMVYDLGAYLLLTVATLWIYMSQ